MKKVPAGVDGGLLCVEEGGCRIWGRVIFKYMGMDGECEKYISICFSNSTPITCIND